MRLKDIKFYVTEQGEDYGWIHYKDTDGIQRQQYIEGAMHLMLMANSHIIKVLETGYLEIDTRNGLLQVPI